MCRHLLFSLAALFFVCACDDIPYVKYDPPVGGAKEEINKETPGNIRTVHSSALPQPETQAGQVPTQSTPPSTVSGATPTPTPPSTDVSKQETNSVEAKLHLVILVNPPLSGLEPSIDDMAHPNLTIFDLANPEKTSAIGNGMVVLHALIRNPYDEPHEFWIKGQKVNLSASFEQSHWRPLTQFGERNECNLSTEPSRQWLPIGANRAKARVFKFDLNNKQLGDEIFPDSQGYFPVAPKEYLFLKMYMDHKTSQHPERVLPLGLLPRAHSCLPEKNPLFYKQCDDKIKRYFVDGCTSADADDPMRTTYWSIDAMKIEAGERLHFWIKQPQSEKKPVEQTVVVTNPTRTKRVH